MPAPPKPEKDKSLESLADFRAKAEPHDAFLGLFAILARIQIEIDGGRVTPTTAALEALSQIYERDAAQQLTLQEWNENAAKISSIMQTVRIPLWAFEALAQGWGRYMTAKPSVEFVNAMGFRKGRGQGKTPVPKTLELKLRDFVLAQAVIIYRRVQNRQGIDLATDKACEHVANEHDIGFETVRDAYHAERKNYRAIAALIGDEMDADY